MAKFQMPELGDNTDESIKAIFDSLAQVHKCQEDGLRQMREAARKGREAVRRTMAENARQGLERAEAMDRRMGKAEGLLDEITKGGTDVSKRLDRVLANQNQTKEALGVDAKDRSTLATIKRPSIWVIIGVVGGLVVAMPTASRVVDAALMAAWHAMVAPK